MKNANVCSDLDMEIRWLYAAYVCLHYKHLSYISRVLLEHILFSTSYHHADSVSWELYFF